MVNGRHILLLHLNKIKHQRLKLIAKNNKSQMMISNKDYKRVHNGKIRTLANNAFFHALMPYF